MLSNALKAVSGMTSYAFLFRKNKWDEPVDDLLGGQFFLYGGRDWSKPELKFVSKVLAQLCDSCTSYIASVTISASANNFPS